MDLIKTQFLLWQSNIEKKFPCYFCGTKLLEKIFSCGFGHNCCFSCKKELCIVCPNSIPLFRNHLAEYLISQFNNLKSCAAQLDVSAIDKKNDKKNSQKVNKATETKIERQNKTTMVTEKDMAIFSGNKSSAVGRKPNVSSSANGSIEVCEGKLKIQANPVSSSSLNLYSCWIGSCAFRGNYENILEHMKANHSSVFTSYEFRGWPHVMNWDLAYSGPNSRQDYAFELRGFGLFVLHISVSHKENMKAHVVMFDSGNIAAQYNYNVEVKCDDYRKSFSAAVDSSRMPRITLQDVTKGLFINENSLLLNTIKLRVNFKCILEINRFNKPIFNDIPDYLPRVLETEKASSKDQKPRCSNRPHFKPRKHFNNPKSKSSVPALLALKLPTPTQPQVQPLAPAALDTQNMMALFEQMLANFSHKMTQNETQNPQQKSSAINSSPILQPSTQQTQEKSLHNIVKDDQARTVSSEAIVPIQSTSGSLLQDLLIFDDSTKSNDSALNNNTDQNPNPANIDESEETDQPEILESSPEGDSKPNNDCKIN